MYNLSVQEIVQHILNNGVTLSQTSLDAIRHIVREEIRKALQPEPEPEPTISFSFARDELTPVILALQSGADLLEKTSYQERADNVRMRLIHLLSSYMAHEAQREQSK